MPANLLYAYPSLLALTVIAWLLISANKRELIISNWQLALLLVGIVGLNAQEFLTYIGLLDPTVLLMKVYYLYVFTSVTALVFLSARVHPRHFLSARPVVFGNLIIASCLALVTLFTNYVISDIESIGYSVTRVPGALYWLFPAYILPAMLMTFYLLCSGSHVSRNPENYKRCRLILLSFTPAIILTCGVITLMQLGFRVNASIVIPISMAFLLVIFVLSEGRKGLFNLLLRVPFTSERKCYRQITSDIENFLAATGSGEAVSLKQLTSNIEKTIVDGVVENSGGSQKKAASILKVSNSSITRKRKERQAVHKRPENE